MVGVTHHFVVASFPVPSVMRLMATIRYFGALAVLLMSLPESSLRKSAQTPGRRQQIVQFAMPC
jgi:hypothetical protein